MACFSEYNAQHFCLSRQDFTYCVFLSRHQSAETQCWRRRFISPYVHTWYVYVACNVHAQVMSAGNSVTATYTSTTMLIALSGA